MSENQQIIDASAAIAAHDGHKVVISLACNCKQ